MSTRRAQRDERDEEVIERSEMYETKREEGKRDERDLENGRERDNGGQEELENDQTKEMKLLCLKYTLRNPADSAGNRRSGR